MEPQLLYERATYNLDTSYYYYRPSLAANTTFAVLFGLSLIAYLVTYGITRRALAFTIALSVGNFLEVLGYAGRLMSWHNVADQNGFLMQICCLTIAPAFMAAGIYLCLRRIVYAFGPENSRIPPEYYTRIFIPCDVISLIFQAAGGGMASSASHSGRSVTPGNNVMITGLSFQVFTLFVFMIFCADFAIRTRRRYQKYGENAFDQSPEFVAMRKDKLFKGFLFALTLSTICIFWRSVYRVAELSEGWTGDLIRKQNLFIGFEGVMVIVAVLVLNVFHPAFCFKAGMTHGLGGIGAKKKQRKQQEQISLEKQSRPDSTEASDASAQRLPV